MTHQAGKTKAERKKERRQAIAAQMKDKLSPIGRATFVEQPLAPPARQATNLLLHGEYEPFVTVKEAWHLHLLHHLMSPSSHIVPPCLALDAQEALSYPFRALGYIGGTTDIGSGTFQPNRFNWNMSDADIRDRSPVQVGRELNYVPVEGRVFATHPIVGNQRMWVWVDPQDYAEPLKINYGSSVASIQGALAINGSGVYSAVASPADSFSVGYGWSTGYDPRVFSTEYLNAFGLKSSVAVSTLQQTELYPRTTASSRSTLPTGRFWTTNVMEWVCDVELKVSVANPTAFSATAMRSRTRDTSMHRLAERVDQPKTADYGLTGPFITSNFSEARWRGTSWNVPHVYYRASDPATDAISPLASSAGNSTELDPRGYANWESLQRCLALMMPVIEIQQNADSDTRSVDLSIEVVIKKCLVPVARHTQSLNVEHLTFPSRLPNWYNSLNYEASVAPVDNTVHMASMPYVVPLQSQMNRNAIQALTSDRSNSRAVQALALQSPPITGSGVVDKSHKDVLAKIQNAGRISNEVVHQAADTLNTGWGIAKGLKRVGSEIWSGLKSAGGALLKFGKKNVPKLLEGAVEAAL